MTWSHLGTDVSKLGTEVTYFPYVLIKPMCKANIEPMSSYSKNSPSHAFIHVLDFVLFLQGASGVVLDQSYFPFVEEWKLHAKCLSPAMGVLLV